jgi:xanthine dehydrogenase accessory factor
MLELMKQGRPFALATVAGSRGSVPAKIGARMIVFADGTQEGTVGGAELEVRVREEALRALAEGAPRTFHFDLTFHKEGGLDLACGGAVNILVEPIRGRAHVLICGGGHIGLELSRLCRQLQYDYSVLDDRAEYAAEARFPDARERHALAPGEFFASADLKRYSHVVICGYSPHVEADVLYEVCRVPYDGYVGLIGSKAKKKSIWDDLTRRGIAAERLSRVEIPIGVPIEAETPAEIALSIMGSLVRAYRNGKA